MSHFVMMDIHHHNGEILLVKGVMLKENNYVQLANLVNLDDSLFTVISYKMYEMLIQPLCDNLFLENYIDSYLLFKQVMYLFQL